MSRFNIDDFLSPNRSYSLARVLIVIVLSSSTDTIDCIGLYIIMCICNGYCKKKNQQPQNKTFIEYTVYNMSVVVKYLFLYSVCFNLSFQMV